MQDDTPQKKAHIPPPVFHLVALFFGYSLDRVVRWQLPDKNWLYGFAAAAAFIGIMLALSAAITFRRHRTTIIPYNRASVLLTSGPFRITRNPIYLGFAFLHLACALAQLSPGMLITLPFAVYAIHKNVIRYEENILAEQFGQHWQQYAARVRRWL